MGHIRFDDDEASKQAAGQQQAPQRTAAAASTSGIRLPNCCSSILLDNNKKNPAYVFKAYFNPANMAVAASTSNNIISLCSVDQAGSLATVGQLKGHTNTISEIGFFCPDNPNMIHSSCNDGWVRGWDIRSGQQVEG